MATEAMTSFAVSVRDRRPFGAVVMANVRSYGLALVGLAPIAWLMALAYLYVGPLIAFVFGGISV